MHDCRKKHERTRLSHKYCVNNVIHCLTVGSLMWPHPGLNTKALCRLHHLWMVRDVWPGVETGAVIGQHPSTAHQAVADWLCVQVGGAFGGPLEVFLRTGRMLQRPPQPARGTVAPGICLVCWNGPASVALQLSHGSLCILRGWGLHRSAHYAFGHHLHNRQPGRAHYPPGGDCGRTEETHL